MVPTTITEATVDFDALARDLEVSSLATWTASDELHDDELDLRLPAGQGITAGCGSAAGSGNSGFCNVCGI